MKSLLVGNSSLNSQFFATKWECRVINFHLRMLENAFPRVYFNNFLKDMPQDSSQRLRSFALVLIATLAYKTNETPAKAFVWSTLNYQFCDLVAVNTSLVQKHANRCKYIPWNQACMPINSHNRRQKSWEKFELLALLTHGRCKYNFICLTSLLPPYIQCWKLVRAISPECQHCIEQGVTQ